MESRDGSAAALADDSFAVGIERNQDRRLAELLDDARGDDADDAGVPTVPAENDRPAIVAVELLFLDLLDARVENAALDRLPLAIELLQLGRDLHRPRKIG